MMNPIYLDYNATTPVAPEVLDAMLPYFRDHFGNPSSGHAHGKLAKSGVDMARRQLAELLGCNPEEIVFTGGGSEAINHAIKGVAEALCERGNHIITSSVEHPAVINTCRYLEGKGYQVTYLPVDATGLVSIESVRGAVTNRTFLISIMHANNETGTIQPIAEIGAFAREQGILLHTDAAQSVGKIRTKADELNVDLLNVAGHKFYAPKGVGALYIRKDTPLVPLIHGAGHESGRRAGTENVALIAGLGKAAELAVREGEARSDRLRSLRDQLHTRLSAAVAPRATEVHSVHGVHLNGHSTARLPNTLNIRFDGIEGEDLLASVPDVAASTGSACHAGSRTPSAVLTAMGIPDHEALGAVRLSVGAPTTDEEICEAARLLGDGVKRLREDQAV